MNVCATVVVSSTRRMAFGGLSVVTGSLLVPDTKEKRDEIALSRPGESAAP